MAVHVGIGLFTGQVPPGSGRTYTQEHRETLDLARLAETLGFDSAWVSEHHGAGDGYFPSLLTVLGAMAAVTDRILLGTGVVLTPFHHPIRLAEDAATVDRLMRVLSEREREVLRLRFEEDLTPVSYTHLTLPTN